MPNNSILLNFYANFIYNQIFFSFAIRLLLNFRTVFIDSINGNSWLQIYALILQILWWNDVFIGIFECYISVWHLYFIYILWWSSPEFESFMNILILIHPNARSSLLNKINRFPMVRQFFWFNVVYNNGQNIKLVVQAKQFVI